jgi:cystathionine beta-lyase
MKLRTRLAQRGRVARSQPGTVNLPVARASTVTFKSMADMQEVQRRFDADEPIPTYGMLNMPLRVAFEELMVELEGGHRAVTLPTGLAANVVAILACVKAGDHIPRHRQRVPAGAALLRAAAREDGRGNHVLRSARGEGIGALMKPNTKLVYVESPGSHTFEMQDIPAIAKVAHARGAAVIHDNAWATGVFYRSFDHGADLVVQPCTKYPAGHSDVIIGAVVANEAWWPRLRDASRDYGQMASPDDIFLALRGMRTLDVRLEQHRKGGLQVARRLQKHPAIARVLHPALESDPGHAIWKRDYLGSTGLFGVELKPCRDAQLAAFIDSLELFALGYSWGGFESLVVPQNIQKSRTVHRGTGGRSSACTWASRIPTISARISSARWSASARRETGSGARRGDRAGDAVFLRAHGRLARRRRLHPHGAQARGRYGRRAAQLLREGELGRSGGHVRRGGRRPRRPRRFGCARGAARHRMRGGRRAVVARARMARPRTARREERRGARPRARALHREPHERFGWARDNFIGASPQANGWSDDWLAFWRDGACTRSCGWPRATACLRS